MVAIQIGANKGFDDFTELTKNKLLSCLILVEPFREHNESLKSCYQDHENVYIENIIITNDSNITHEKIFYHEEDSKHANMYELASLNKNHSLKIRDGYREDGLRYREIECSTINNLFDKYNLNKIDILFIDTEGYDDKIIESINFDRFRVDKIYYENLHIDSFSLKCFLEEKKYSVQKGVGYGGWSDVASLIK